MKKHTLVSTFLGWFWEKQYHSWVLNGELEASPLIASNVCHAKLDNSISKRGLIGLNWLVDRLNIAAKTTILQTVAPAAGLEYDHNCTYYTRTHTGFAHNS